HRLHLSLPLSSWRHRQRTAHSRPHVADAMERFADSGCCHARKKTPERGRQVAALPGKDSSARICAFTSPSGGSAPVRAPRCKTESHVFFLEWKRLTEDGGRRLAAELSPAVPIGLQDQQ